eukprot:11677530-Heterocapsa_arctica.AAC.1
MFAFTQEILSAARGAASLPAFHRLDPLEGGRSEVSGGDFPSAVVATDLIRAGQFHHATGAWVAVSAPLALYSR